VPEPYPERSDQKKCSDELTELVVISWEFVNQRQPGTPDYDPSGIKKLREQIADRFAASNLLSTLNGRR